MLTQDMLARAGEQAGLSPASFVLLPFGGPRSGLALNGDAPFYPASMVKTPLAMAALALVADDELALDHAYAVEQTNMTANDAGSPLVVGHVCPLLTVVDLMLTRSDNVATNMLFDIVGRERATRIVQRRFGLGGTAFHRKLSGSLPLIDDPGWDGVHRNTHPPFEAARAFELIARDEVPFASLLHELLGRQEWNNKLSAGLSPGDRFAHKTGDTDEVTHDGGIITTAQGAVYVLVAYTAMPSNDGNNARFGTFMRALRPYL